ILRKGGKGVTLVTPATPFAVGMGVESPCEAKPTGATPAGARSDTVAEGLLQMLVERGRSEREAPAFLTPLALAPVERGALEPTGALEVTLLGNEGADRVEGLTVAASRGDHRRGEHEPAMGHEATQSDDGVDQQALELSGERGREGGIVRVA